MTAPPLKRFESCLDEATASGVRAMVARFGPFGSYVDKPLSEGVGKRLTRRHDALMNYYRQAASRGRPEPMDVMAARTNLFRGTFGEPGAPTFPGAEALWEHAGFAEAAAAHTGKPLVRPTMLYANILLPGMELAVHTDTPAYRGMDQTNTPEWLLVVMAHSGLFEAHRVHVGAGVAFFSSPSAGEFVVYADGPAEAPRRVPARANTAVALDSDTLFHGVARVGAPDAPAPPARIGMTITWEPPAARWVLRRPDGGEVARYGWDEVRLSFQWKAKCYRDEAEEAQVAAGEGGLSADQVVERLVEDLRGRGELEGERPDDTQLALRLIDAYVAFPTA